MRHTVITLSILLPLLLSPLAGAQVLLVPSSPSLPTHAAVRAQPMATPSSRAMDWYNVSTAADFATGTSVNLQPLAIADGAVGLDNILDLGPPILGDNTIGGLVRLANGTLVGGTYESGRLFSFDPQTLTFSLLNGGLAAIAGEDHITALALAANGTVWGVATDSVTVNDQPAYAFVYDPTSDTVIEANGGASLTTQRIWSICVGQDDTLWAGSNSGSLIRVDAATLVATNLGNLGGVLGFGRPVRSVVTGPDGDIWVGSTNGANEAYVVRVGPGNNTGYQTRVVNNGDRFAQALVFDDLGFLWGMTDEDGAAGVTSGFVVNPAVAPSTPLFDMFFGNTKATWASLLSDDGMIYFGTDDGGLLLRYDPVSRRAENLDLVIGGQLAVTALVSSPDGTLWVGTSGGANDGHLVRLKPYSWFRGLPGGLGPVGPQALLPDGHTVVGIAAPGFAVSDRLYLLDTDTHGISLYNGGASPLPAQQLVTIVATEPGEVWVGSGGPSDGSVLRIDPYNGTVLSTIGGGPLLAGARIGVLFVDPAGTVWGATIGANDQVGGRIFSIDPLTELVTWHDVAAQVAGVDSWDSAALLPDGRVLLGSASVLHLATLDLSNGLLTDQGGVLVNTNHVTDLDLGADGRVYVSTQATNGNSALIGRFDPVTDQFIGVGVAFNGEQTLLAGSSGGLGNDWFGTAGFGELVQLTESTGAITQRNRPFGGLGTLLLGPCDDAYTISGAGTGNGVGEALMLTTGGSWTSPPIDAGETVAWLTLGWTETAGNGPFTDVRMRTRSADDALSLADAPWEPWITSSGAVVDSPSARFLQYQIAITHESGRIRDTRFVEEVHLSWEHIPALELGQVADRTNASRGEQVLYTVYYNNTGLSAAARMDLQFTLPAGMQFIATSEPTARIGDTFTIFDVQPGSHNLTVTGLISASTPEGTNLTTQPNATYTSPSGVLLPLVEGNTWQVLVIPLVPPQVVVAVSLDRPAALPGEQLTLRIDYLNIGEGDAGSLTLTHLFDTDLWTYTTSSDEAAKVGNEFRLGIIDAGTGGNLTITGTVDPALDEVATLVTNVSYRYTNLVLEEVANGTSSDVSAQLLGGPEPALSLVLETTRTELYAGQVMVVDVNITNNGGGDAVEADLVLAIDPLLEVLDDTDEGNLSPPLCGIPCPEGARGWHYAALKLPPSTSHLLRLTLRLVDSAPQSGNVTVGGNVSYVGATGLPRPLAIALPVSVRLLAPPIILMDSSLSLSAQPVRPNSLVTATIRITNAGNRPLPWADFNLRYDGRLSLRDPSASYADAPGHWNLTTVSIGTFPLTVKVVVGVTLGNGTYPLALDSTYVDANGTLVHSHAAANITVLIPEPVVPPELRSTTPADRATDVPVNTTIVLRFSTLMDQSSVESALTFVPAITGTFSWTGRNVTLTPSTPLEDGTHYTVRLGPSAESAQGLAIVGGEKLFTFTTAKAVVPPPGPSPIEQVTTILSTNWLLFALLVGGIVVAIVLMRRRQRSQLGPLPGEEPAITPPLPPGEADDDAEQTEPTARTAHDLADALDEEPTFRGGLDLGAAGGTATTAPSTGQAAPKSRWEEATPQPVAAPEDGEVLPQSVPAPSFGEAFPIDVEEEEVGPMPPTDGAPAESSRESSLEDISALLEDKKAAPSTPKDTTDEDDLDALLDQLG